MPILFDTLGPLVFGLAITHTFSVGYFQHRGNLSLNHAGLWHLLGEVEVVFGFWAILFVIFFIALEGKQAAVDYIQSRNYTEPLFVFAIMVVAATRPVLRAADTLMLMLNRCLPLTAPLSNYLIILIFVPLLGSFITEPAAMTLAALVLSKQIFAHPVSERLKYGTLGVLFVNISIGGTLTPFAAPPVLMVAETWGWDFVFMSSMFGWKAAIAITFNSIGATILFKKELISFAPLQGQSSIHDSSTALRIPNFLTLVHLSLLAAIVFFAHYPAMFLGLFLLFLGIAHAYPQYQDRLILKEALLVAFFLAGLVVLGGQQQGWLQPLLMSMSTDTVFFSAIVLTAFTDNAALTYLGSLVEGLSSEFKYALVAGAVTGGGLTIIANAPNPAGIAILRKHFHEGAVSPLYLLFFAIPPTLIATISFRYL